MKGTLKSAALDLDIVRDRAGSFTPRLVPKESSRLGGFAGMIISLHVGWLNDDGRCSASPRVNDLHGPSHETMANPAGDIVVDA
jgi:putative transposase